MTQIVQLNYDELQEIIKTCLRDSIAEIKAIPDPPKLSDRCTLPEACEITGLSRSLIYKMSMDGTIPKEKYGKRLVFSRKALTEWMQDRTVSTASPEAIMTERLSKTAKKKLNTK
jgi:excisionase family DNA binding protein